MAPVFDTNKRRYKLVLRIQCAQELQHSSSHGAYCKLYVGPTVHTDGTYKAARAANTDATPSTTSDDVSDPNSSSANDVRQLHVRRTRTQLPQHAKAPRETVWNEVFVVPLRRDVAVARQIVSIRVKSQHVFFCPVIGVCAISLAHLCPNERLEQWVPLEKGSKPAGRLRVMVVVIPLVDPKGRRGRRHEPNPDVVAARAACIEADAAVERLVQTQLQRQRERRQKRVEPCSSTRRGGDSDGDRIMDNQQVEDDGMVFRSNVGQAKIREHRHKRGDLETWPPLPNLSMPNLLPPLGTRGAMVDSDSSISNYSDWSASGKLPSDQNDDREVLSTMVEYEQRLDRKLLQVRKEMARLRKLKSQLKQYLPDLQMDSDSDDSMDYDDEEEEAEMLLSCSSLTMISSSSE
ncbi:unnamed protein product [Hyaloperonospora brassicae]|uniref:C2 domain-containing protein n=1 Tax=Hyaloperonospora brassicae TaxID=162125 RepID=A0AAV0SVB0_HYABA|nr:unnamed protein product [Hyaloperonospora brassicae]